MTLNPLERSTIFACTGCGIVALLFPYPPVKVVTGIVLALTFLRVSFREFYLALALFIFFLPLQAVAGIGSILVPGLNPQTGFVAFLGFLALMQPPLPASPDLRVVRNPATAPLACMLAVLIFSAFYSAAVSEHTLMSQLTNVKNGFLYTVLLWLCFAKVRRNHDKLLIVVFVFLAVLLNVVVSLRNVFDTLSAAVIFLRHRAASLISDQPNLYGGFLALYLFFFIGFLLYYPLSKRQHITLAICTGAVALNLLYTLSRGAWLAAALVTVFLVLTKSRRMLAPLAVFLVALMFAAPEVVVDRWQDTVTSEEYSLKNLTAEESEADEAASRIVQWRTFPSMFMLNPLIGIGKGNYAETHYARGHDVMVRSPHSSIIALGVEEGMIGLGCYIWLLTTIYRSAAQRFRIVQNPTDKALSFGTMSATLCLFFWT